MAPNTWRAAIVGCGANGIGHGTRDRSDLWFTHAGAYHQHADVRLVAAADVASDRRNSCHLVWGIEHVYSSARDLFEAEQIDIVSVCTPDDAHTDVVLEAIEAGVPVVFCEKPIAVSVPEAERMVKAARRRRCVLAVNHHRRWEAGHREVRATIACGSFGDVLSARVLFAGGLHRVGTHAVDLLRYFFGDVAIVLRADISDRGALHTRLGFGNGVEATIEAWPKRGRDGFDFFEVDIVGTKGRILIADFGSRIYHWGVVSSEEYRSDLELARTPSVIKSDMRTAFLNGVDAMVMARTSGGPTASPGEDALAALRVLDAIDAASRSAAAVPVPVS